MTKDWLQTELGNIAAIRSGSTPARAKQERYYAVSGIPWVKTMDLNNGLIVSTDEHITEVAVQETSCRVLPKGTVLVAMYGGFNQIGRTGLLGIEAATNQAVSALQVDQALAVPEFILCWLNAHVDDWKRLAASTRKDPNITREDVARFPILLPSLGEQHRIVDILSSWDYAISSLQQIIHLKQQRRRGIMQQLLLGRQRFAQFVHSETTEETLIGPLPAEWSYVRIGDIAQQNSERNSEGLDLPVLSCTKYDGLVDSLTYFGRQIFSDDTSTYRVVRRHQFAYATNHIEEGSIGYQDLHDEALISPMYTVFETSQGVNDRFLYALLKTETYRQIFERSTSASVDRRGSLRWNEFAQIKVPLPSLEEQHAIAEVLDACDQEIALLTRKLALLKQQRRGLTQQLLTGKVRVPA